MNPTEVAPEGPVDDGVAVRTLVVRELPLLVAAVGEQGRGPQLCDALHERGLQPLDRFIGVRLPRGARVGFMVDAHELRLVDDRDDALLRAPRSGIDEAWLEASMRLKGTMTVLVRGEAPAPDLSPAALVERLDRDARAGVAWGAIVGVAEERPTLPLLFS